VRVEDELARIELVLVEALNAIHTARRRIDNPDVGSVKPEWTPVAEAAHKLDVDPKTAWSHPQRMGANWPETGSRQVNWTILKRLRPPRS
jgi:hypothetical protein